MWKIIKTWLPPKSIEKIKFVDKKSLKEFVEPDQALVSWGGTDNYEYQFEAEATNAFVPVANGDIEARKVRSFLLAFVLIYYYYHSFLLLLLKTLYFYYLHFLIQLPRCCLKSLILLTVFVDRL